MTKKDLIYTLLRSEKNILEDNYMKYINVTTDNELKDKINRVRILVTILGNALTKEEKRSLEKNYTKQKVQEENHKENESLLILLIY